MFRRRLIEWLYERLLDYSYSWKLRSVDVHGRLESPLKGATRLLIEQQNEIDELKGKVETMEKLIFNRKCKCGGGDAN